jgi:hypothetical protein
MFSSQIYNGNKGHEKTYESIKINEVIKAL